LDVTESESPEKNPSSATSEKVWHAGGLEPMPIRKLPDAPPSIHILGPTVFLLALGVGMGETYMWPRLVLVFGPDIRWLFLVGVTLQAVVMLEMSRYAMATGESIFMGAARVFKPIMWFFFATAALIYIWPGHLSAGAASFESLTGIPWKVTAVVAMLGVGVLFSLLKSIYDTVEKMLGVFIAILVIGSAIIAAMVGSWSDLADTIVGMFSFGTGFTFPTPDGGEINVLNDAVWFPVIVGSVAFAGPSGMQQMWYTLQLRDSGAGMGAHIPKVRGLIHADEAEAMPSRGFMFDTEDEAEMAKWKGWRKWVTFDALALFWGITILVTLSFTVLAMAAGRQDPGVRESLIAGDKSAALEGMSASFAAVGGDVLGGVFFAFLALVGLNATLGLFDSFSKGQADMTFYFVPGMRKFNMSKIYAGWLWAVIGFGILILLFGPADGPTGILDTLAFLSAFAMGAYCVVLLLVNNLMLPKKIRPGILSNGIIAFAALFYLGMLFYAIGKFGFAAVGEM
jgi:hypothetical protein